MKTILIKVSRLLDLTIPTKTNNRKTSAIIKNENEWVVEVVNKKRQARATMQIISASL